MWGIWTIALALGVSGCEKEEGGASSGTTAKLKLVPSAEVVQVGDEVSFVVYDGESDVTASAQVVNVDSEEVLNGTFVPQQVGCSRFVARLGERESATVEISATGTFDPAAMSDPFYKRVLVQKFTATWCGFCPQMTAALAQLDEEEPGRLVHMSVHVNDGFAISAGEQLSNDYQIFSIPQALFDYADLEATYLIANLRRTMSGALERRADCGIAIESNVVKNTIQIDARLRFAVEGAYRVCCAVVEDNIYYAEGTSVDGSYQHVLRSFATARTGDDLGQRKAGEEYPCHFEIPVGSSWMTSNCRVLVYLLKIDTASQSLLVDNVASCAAVEGLCDFAYEASDATQGGE